MKLFPIFFDLFYVGLLESILSRAIGNMTFFMYNDA